MKKIILIMVFMISTVTFSASEIPDGETARLNSEQVKENDQVQKMDGSVPQEISEIDKQDMLRGETTPTTTEAVLDKQDMLREQDSMQSPLLMFLSLILFIVIIVLIIKKVKNNNISQ